ncbi:hypothetical protein GA0116948_103182 [Chitinophaga costaii]|uniref:N-acetyltransferase domain-containing protein n=1 Tax=Chitinophaga costaii TaxID=1335309 RepID=A0A1C4BN65_9BACT|nr:hypothetical protein [Chitinophaga costaii]PUZ27538.1 hypothetical protein DCM91_04745 [Chitinophaga costaii]SCC08359.1 hypothetical protein GA0116948_103182 [Chitinophaga costaii]
MELIIVDTSQKARLFLDVHVAINKGNPAWIQPLDKDIEEIFDKNKNKAFRHGEAIRWVLLDDHKKPIGRIAAFVNKKYKNKGDEQPTGGVGFFDSIDDQAVANLLFDTAKQWLQERGMGAMDGPINFGERDRWWGLLVEGFHEPLYCMNFNPPYYKSLMENYGFLPFFNQVCLSMDLRKRLHQKFFNRHAQIAANPEYTARHFKKGELEKFAEDFTIIYNKAWAGHGGGKDMAKAQAVKIFESMKPVIDEETVWFVYHNGQPIGCWLNLPELNQWFKYLHGKFGLLQKLQFLWLKAFKKNNKLTGVVFGVIPEYQAKGIDAYLIIEGANNVQSGKTYLDFEMQWIGDFNPKMINIAAHLGAVRSRTLTTYRYLFDRSKPFKRHPILAE